MKDFFYLPMMTNHFLNIYSDALFITITYHTISMGPCSMAFLLQHKGYAVRDSCLL